MLTELKVSNFAIIENIQVNFESGLNILSGETGAGKSVLLKGLGLLMGLKGSSEQIRSGCEFAFIEGSFDLKDRPDILERVHDNALSIDDHQLIVRRVLSEGKSRIYINGSLCTLQQLRDIVSPLIEVTGHHTPLIEMTGQHENKHLMSKSYHLDLLDEYSGLWELRNEYQFLYTNWRSLNKDAATLRERIPEGQRQLDFLRFQRKEIIELDLNPGEEHSLESRIRLMKSAHKMLSFYDQVESSLQLSEGALLTQLHRLTVFGNEVSSIDPSVKTIVELLGQAKNVLDETLFQVSRQRKESAEDPQELEFLESRFSQIKKVLKKYGPTSDEVLASLLKIETEIHQIENVEDQLSEIEKQIDLIESQLVEKATELHQQRTKHLSSLEAKVNDELLDLNMKGVIFSIQCVSTFQESLTQLNSTGCTDLEFCIQSSKKDLPRSLGKIASGGELSRILLSLKKVIGVHHFPRTYLFDEVDSGVSGETAQKVGRKLKQISQGQQVICITHLPQVASFADVHFLIQKNPTKSMTKMEVTRLNKKDRIHEVARLVSGEKITSASLRHAEEMISASH